MAARREPPAKQFSARTSAHGVCSGDTTLAHIPLSLTCVAGRGNVRVQARERSLASTVFVEERAGERRGVLELRVRREKERAWLRHAADDFGSGANDDPVIINCLRPLQHPYRL